MIFKNSLRQPSPMEAGVKTVVFGTLTLLLLLLLVVQVRAKEGKIKVVASIFPAYDFARVVGGEGVELTQLLPPGVEAHGFSPTPRNIIRINRADLFLYTGSRMEPRVAKMLRSLDAAVKVVDLSSGLLVTEDDHHDNHDHHGIDPHFWLDPHKAKVMVEMISQSLIKVDPVHAQGYKRRTDAYLGELTKLDGKIRDGLVACRQQTIVSGGHFAFGHFIRRYGLKAISAYPGFSADGKPSPRGIANLIKTMKSLGSTAVYHEELMDPKVARIIVEETGAELLLLHGGHNVSKAEKSAGVSYLSIMEGNLSRLLQGLSCQ